MNFSSLPILIVLPLSTPLVAAACSSGGLGSYDANLKLEAMNAEDATQYCQAIKEHTESKVSTKNASCATEAAIGSASAMTDTELYTACQDIYNSCIASSGQPSSTDSCEKFSEAAMSCTGLTVAEFNGCTDESISGLQKLADPKFCSTLKVDSSPMAPPSPRCDVVRDKCPALLAMKR